MIKHYVFSCRKLVLKNNGNLSYLRQFISTENGADGALDHFNLGMYEIDDEKSEFDTDLPSFISENDAEKDDYLLLNQNFQLPKEHSKEAFKSVFSNLKNTPDKMLYIYLYGFGNNVASELKKQVVPMTECYFSHRNNESSPVGQMLFLSWPSQGKAEYLTGEDDDVNTMSRLLAVFWLKLYHYVIEDPDQLFSDWKPKIVFHAQSMGNRIMVGAIGKINEWTLTGKFTAGFMNRFFHRIVMTGADIPSDSMNDNHFPERAEVHEFAERVILFHNKDDFALWISRRIFGSNARLGRDQLSIENLPGNIELVELNRNTAEFVGHMYFTKKPRIVEGLKNAIGNYHFDGKPLDTSKSRLVVYTNEETPLISRYFS